MRLQAQATPPLHDAHNRPVIALTGDWEVRTFSAGGATEEAAKESSGLQVQLVHVPTATSVVAPSRLTGGHYEVFPVNGRPLRVPDAPTVGKLLSALGL